MIVFPCHVCQTSLLAEETRAGQLVRCPRCQTVCTVPVASTAPAELATVGAGPQAGGPSASTFSASPAFRPPPDPFRVQRPTGRRYGFNCPFCSSRLEANESVAAQDGQCPTCNNTITIPILDRYGRVIDPKTRQIIKQDPHPVHAYAAAGSRAPVIVRTDNRKQAIRCPRCEGISAITANNCKSCGMPFTMEGTTVEVAGAANGYAVASLVLGLIGLPTSCAVIPSILAIVFGIVAIVQVGSETKGGKGMAIAGTILGGVGIVIAALIHMR